MTLFGLISPGCLFSERQSLESNNIPVLHIHKEINSVTIFFLPTNFYLQSFQHENAWKWFRMYLKEFYFFSRQGFQHLQAVGILICVCVHVSI